MERMRSRISLQLIVGMLVCLNATGASPVRADDAKWVPLTSPQRAGSVAVLDPVSRELFMFGGHDPQYRSSVWKYAIWPQVSSSVYAGDGGGPTPRSYSSAVFDSQRRRMIVFGGTDVPYNGFFADTWALPTTGGAVWTEIVPSGAAPPIRGFHAAIYDPGRDRMVIFGGRMGGVNQFSRLNDVLALQLGGTPT